MIDTGTIDWKAVVASEVDRKKAAPDTRRSRAELPRLLVMACRAASVHIDEVLSDCRHPQVTLARRAFVHAARTHTTASFPEIARTMSRKAHTSAWQQWRDSLRNQAAKDIAFRAADLMGWIE